MSCKIFSNAIELGFTFINIIYLFHNVISRFVFIRSEAEALNENKMFLQYQQYIPQLNESKSKFGARRKCLLTY